MDDSLAALIHAADAGTFPPVGAHVSADGVGYRVWAPEHRETGVRIESATSARNLDLEPDGRGYFTGLDPAGVAGDRYRFSLDGELRPDPASRYQPQGVEAASQVVDPSVYRWQCTGWRRPDFAGRVIYELHVGTFTQAGTFRAAIERLDTLVELGVNTLEMMPLADFSGERNWGYDGVFLFSPARCYGTPDDLRALVDAAHVRGLSVILDVVYNHLGPSGNVLETYSPQYFHTDPAKANLWGRALNYDEPAVRQFFLQNTCQWLDEFRFDGLRLDAVHAIKDDTPRHLVADLAAAARARGAWVIAEDERNQVNLITPADQGGWGLNGLWSDDLHHTLRVALTGQHQSHFKSYTGKAGEWAKTLRQGWFYDGQYFPHWKGPRGTPAGHIPPERFVICISNHDQVGNRPLGDRLHDATTPAAYRAVSMLLCLAPYTPMLFMGQEWAAETPFPYFTDLPGEIGEKMGASRLKEFRHYGADYSDDLLARMPDPQAATTFESAKLNWGERAATGHQGVLALYRECLRLRAREPLFQSPARDRWAVDALGEHTIALRWFDPQGDWLLVLSLTAAKPGIPQSQPGSSAEIPGATAITRSSAGARWTRIFSSNDPQFGGGGEDGEDLVLATPGATLSREVRD